MTEVRARATQAKHSFSASHGEPSLAQLSNLIMWSPPPQQGGHGPRSGQ